MPQCSVTNCTKMGGHKFPTDRLRRNRWKMAIRRGQESNKTRPWSPCKNALVCSDHFYNSDYQELNQYGFKPRKRQLKPDAVPHVPHPTVTANIEREAAVGERAERASRRSDAVDEYDKNIWSNLCGESVVVDDTETTVDGALICCVCNFTTSDRRAFEDHAATHPRELSSSWKADPDPRRLECGMCDYQTGSVQDFINHTSNHPRPNTRPVPTRLKEESTFTCDDCGCNYLDATLFLDHIEQHSLQGSRVKEEVKEEPQGDDIDLGMEIGVNSETYDDALAHFLLT